MHLLWLCKGGGVVSPLFWMLPCANFLENILLLVVWTWNMNKELTFRVTVHSTKKIKTLTFSFGQQPSNYEKDQSTKSWRKSSDFQIGQWILGVCKCAHKQNMVFYDPSWTFLNFRELKQTRRRRKRERHLKMWLRVSAIIFQLFKVIMPEKFALTIRGLNWNQRLGHKKTKLSICHRRPRNCKTGHVMS